ncbi:hypothetical protein [Thioalkalivibrio sp. ALE31]|uniref:hypothetical protein n=1 Tax=Thioalkalivibrio sp. ALE31 TaxID=1158182 RepID=UPI0009DAF180|nr:hypothetical protein [Thioalkalivibrio sp. ALE31]
MRYHFIAGEEISEFFYAASGNDAGRLIDAEYERFTNSGWAWIAQTALLMRDAGLEVTIGGTLRPDSINVGLAADLRSLPRSADCFRVSVDADQLRARWSNRFVVQNQRQAGRRAFWVPHWPQPGLLRRDPERKHFSNVVFFGLARNLEGDQRWWREVCRRHGMKFSIRAPSEWNDYRDVDVAVGIRSFGNKAYDNKPPTKLINAWLAGCVFIGGADSAYQQIGVAGQDHFVASDVGELESLLAVLSHQPRVGKDAIAEGRRRLTRVGSRENTRDRWVKLLSGEIRESFERWSAGPKVARKIPVAVGTAVDGGVLLRNRLWRWSKGLKSRLV